MSAQKFYAELKRKVGDLSAQERKFLNGLSGRGNAKAYTDLLAEGDEEWASETVIDAVELIEAFRGSKKKSITSTAIRDRRWTLIEDIEQKIHPDKEPWKPLTIKPTMNWADVLHGVGSRKVTIEFDWRMSLKVLQQQLEYLWTEMNENDYVRRTRPLSSRNVSLIRHVCIDSHRELSLADRWRTWNQKYSNKPEWQYKDASHFSSRFHDAERRLTGRTQGLAFFYKQEEWERVENAPEFVQQLANEDFSGFRSRQFYGYSTAPSNEPISYDEVHDTFESLVPEQQGWASEWTVIENFMEIAEGDDARRLEDEPTRWEQLEDDIARYEEKTGGKYHD